jgi:hypothetical protein
MLKLFVPRDIVWLTVGMVLLFAFKELGLKEH